METFAVEHSGLPTVVSLFGLQETDVKRDILSRPVLRLCCNRTGQAADESRSPVTFCQ